MQFKSLALLTLTSLLSFASAAPSAAKPDGGFEVVIKYVCPTSTKAPITTITSTNTKYVVVTLQTAYGTTSTVGYITTDTYTGTGTSTTAAATGYHKH